MNIICHGCWVREDVNAKAKELDVDLHPYFTRDERFDIEVGDNIFHWFGRNEIGPIEPGWSWVPLQQMKDKYIEICDDGLSMEIRGAIKFKLIDSVEQFVLERALKLNGPVKPVELGKRC